MKSLGAFFALIVFSSLVHAATVEFIDGRKYSGDIVAQNEEFLTLDLNGIKTQIPRSNIASINTKSPAPPALADGEIRILPVTGAPPNVLGSAPPTQPNPESAPLEPQPIVVSTEEPANPERLEMKLPLPKDPLVRDRLHDAVNFLRLDANVDNSRAALRNAGDEGLAALATFGLYNDSPVVRSRSAALLRELGGKRALKVLIEAFYAAAHPTIEPYQVDFVQTLMRQISALTGQNFYFYAQRSTMAPTVAQNMTRWWKQHYFDVPPQLGEPQLNPDSPDYKAQLTELRALVLQRREFAGVNYTPQDWINPAPPPGEIGGYPQVPTIPRDSQIERNVSTSQQPASPKPLNPDRDAPGILRQQEYLNRIQQAMRDGTYR